MATSASAIITLRESASGTNNTLTSRDNQGVKVRHMKTTRGKWLCRCIGSRSLLLILIWQFITSCSVEFTVQRMKYLHHQLKKGEEDEFAALLLVRKSHMGIVATLSCILIPIVSLVAEVVIGRYKLVSLSLKAMWLISIGGSLISVCADKIPLGESTIFTFQLFLVFIPQYLFLGAFIATTVPLAMDQIIGGSDANVSAFLQWLAWAHVSGIALPNLFIYDCTDLQSSEVSTMMSLLPVILLSVGLILDFYFHHKLVKEPVTVNPMSLIFKVLKYAAKHKYPVQRSAFTYCDNEQPSRLDYGKSKYGGPFTTEQVEDVKTFWRVLTVILVLSLFAFPLAQQFESTSAMEDRFGSGGKCSIAAVSNSFFFQPSATLMFFIPLYELLVYPCLRNRGPSILQSAGIGAAAAILSSLLGLAAVTAGIILDNGASTCMFVKLLPDERVLKIVLGIPFNFVLGVSALALNKSSVEFICAQAPYNANGVLIGVFLTFEVLCIALGTLVYEAWKNQWLPILSTSTCGIWFYLTTLVLAVVSSALLGLVTRWYKARERDEIPRSQALIEDMYYKYHQHVQQLTHLQNS